MNVRGKIRSASEFGYSLRNDSAHIWCVPQCFVEIKAHKCLKICRRKSFVWVPICPTSSWIKTLAVARCGPLKPELYILKTTFVMARSFCFAKSAKSIPKTSNFSLELVCVDKKQINSRSLILTSVGFSPVGCQISDLNSALCTNDSNSSNLPSFRSIGNNCIKEYTCIWYADFRILKVTVKLLKNSASPSERLSYCHLQEIDGDL